MTDTIERIPLIVDLSYYAERYVDRERRMALLYYVDGTIRFQHTCDRGARGVIVCAPALQDAHVHTPRVVQPYPDVPHGRYITDAPSITPSILCKDCGTHGFVTAGRWEGC